jgi:ketosteroid isomerase-like protein
MIELDAIEKLLKEQDEAWNAGDLITFMGFYEPMAVFHSEGKASTWMQRYEHYNRKHHRNGKAEFDRLVTTISRIYLFENNAIVLGAWSTFKDGEESKGVFTLCLEKKADRWLIFHDHSS